MFNPKTFNTTTKFLALCFLALNLYGCKNSPEKKQKPIVEDPAKLMLQECNQNIAESCLKLGSLYLEAGRAQEAITALELGCAIDNSRGTGESCATLSVLYFQGTLIPPDMEKTMRLAEQACAKGVIDICEWHQELLEKFPLSQTLAKQCNAGVLETCTELGFRYSFDPRYAPDYPQALSYLDKACLGDNTEACVLLSNLYAEGLGVKPNLKKSFELVQKACDKGDYSGCAHLALFYTGGLEIDPDVDKAIELFEKSCRGGLSYACQQAGLLLASTRPDQLDDAAELYRIGCESNHQSSCNELGKILIANPDHLVEHKSKAFELFKVSCNQKDWEGCFLLGTMYEKGFGITKNLEKANDLILIACENGLLEACQYTPASY